MQKKDRERGSGGDAVGEGRKRRKRKKEGKKEGQPWGGVVLGWGGQNRIQAQAHIQRDQ